MEPMEGAAPEIVAFHLGSTFCRVSGSVFFQPMVAGVFFQPMIASGMFGQESIAPCIKCRLEDTAFVREGKEAPEGRRMYLEQGRR